MLQERPDVTRAVIQELKTSSPVEEFNIYRRNGVEAFSDLATLEEVRRHAELAPEVQNAIRGMERAPGAAMTGPLFTQAVQTLQTQESLEERGDARFFTLHQPVASQAK